MFPLLPVLVLGLAIVHCNVTGADERSPITLDPAAWGSDHVSQPVPEYVTGDECLFCHRGIGSSWPGNRHQLTIRPASPTSAAIRELKHNPATAAIATQVQFLLGTKRHVRLLKRSKEYGKFEMLSTAFLPSDSDKDAGRLANSSNPQWDGTTFAEKCAGCHTTAVDAKTKAFSSISLDCYTCHGNVDLNHSKDTSRVLLSVTNQEARQVVSTCGQCHLRGGRSRGTGLPYPNHFVAGDNVFRDFEVNWPDAALKELGPVDRHVFASARNVAVYGHSELSCLACHEVHAQSTEKHQSLSDSAICASCHVQTTLKRITKPIQAHSRVCSY